MGVDYIPEKDLKAVAWMRHFSAALVENPELYRTTPEDAAEISARNPPPGRRES